MTEQVKWTQPQYGASESLDLGIIKVTVYYDTSVPQGQPSFYKYRFGSIQSKMGYAEMSDAKRDAIKSAKKQLQIALAKLASVEE